MAKRRTRRAGTWSPWFAKKMAEKGYSNPKKPLHGAALAAWERKQTGKRAAASMYEPEQYGPPGGSSVGAPAPARKRRSVKRRKAVKASTVYAQAKGIAKKAAAKQLKAMTKEVRKEAIKAARKEWRKAHPVKKARKPVKWPKGYALERAARKENRALKARLKAVGASDYTPPPVPGKRGVPAALKVPFAMGRPYLVKADKSRPKRKGHRAPGWWKFPSVKGGYRYYPNRSRRRRGMRRNAGGLFGGLGTTLKSMVKPVVAGGVGFFASRVLGNYVGTQTWMPPSLRGYTPVLSGAVVALGTFMLGKKVAFVRTYESPVMIGAALSVVEGLVSMLTSTPSLQPVQQLVTPLAGFGDDLDVYEAALRGPGLNESWADYRAGDEMLLRGMADSDGMGEYIDTSLGEYVMDSSMGEYLDEGMQAMVEDDQGYIDIPEGVEGEDYQEAMTGFGASEDFAGLTVDEGLAGEYGMFGDNGMGIFGDEGMGADEKIATAATKVATAALAKGATPVDAAKVAYDVVKKGGAPAGKRTQVNVARGVKAATARVRAGARRPIRTVRGAQIPKAAPRKQLAELGPFSEGSGIFKTTIFG